MKMEIIHVSKNKKHALKSASDNSVNIQQEQVNMVKKCLFGCPNPEDVENLIEEQRQIDRDRIKNRFGFDVEDFENLENCPVVIKDKRRNSGKVVKAKKNNRSKSYNLIKRITDFYQVRKANVQHPAEDKK